MVSQRVTTESVVKGPSVSVQESTHNKTALVRLNMVVTLVLMTTFFKTPGHTVSCHQKKTTKSQLLKVSRSLQKVQVHGLLM